MKAAVAPGLNTKWEIRDIPTPKPGPNQVLIKIHASGICYTDVHITRGLIPTQFPRTLGHEPVGEIAELGPGVSTRKVGDRVGVPWIQESCGRCEWCFRGKPMFCPDQVGTGVQTMGGHAEYMLARADATVLLPEGIAYEMAAPIFCAGYTVWSGLRWAEPRPGETVAVLGVGGLGHLAVQYARASGFRTVALSRSADKSKMIKSLGADEVVQDGNGLARVGGADIILATGNSAEAMEDGLKGLRPDGRLVVMGLDANPLKLPIADLIMRRIHVVGSMQNKIEYLYEALRFVAEGKVRVHAETFPLREAGEAYQRVEEGRVRFRAVLQV